jgi:hypothetical protein
MQALKADNVVRCCDEPLALASVASQVELERLWLRPGEIACEFFVEPFASKLLPAISTAEYHGFEDNFDCCRS